MPDVLEALDAIEPAQIPAAIARLSARLLVPPEPADELLTVEQAAAVLRVDRRWVYKHAKQLGAARLSRRKLRLSRRKVERYVERQK